MLHGVTRDLGGGGKHCTGVKCNPHGIEIPGFFAVSLPRIQTGVFRAFPQFFHQTTQISGYCIPTGVPTKYLHPSPKTSFWGGPFNAKSIIERTLRKSHVNGATKLKLHSYIGINFKNCILDMS